MPAAPPFVSYATMSEAIVAAAEWPYVYASLQAYKAHVQEYPGCERMDVYVGVEDGGDVRLHCYTTWDTPEQLEVFQERGYTFERLLLDLGAGEIERSMDMENLF
jgi:hypothetical protein